MRVQIAKTTRTIGTTIGTPWIGIEPWLRFWFMMLIAMAPSAPTAPSFMTIIENGLFQEEIEKIETIGKIPKTKLDKANNNWKLI